MYKGPRRPSAPSSNTCRLLARDHAAPESTLALAKAGSLGCARVRPLAWCSRPRNSAALLEGALDVRAGRLGRTFLGRGDTGAGGRGRDRAGASPRDRPRSPRRLDDADRHRPRPGRPHCRAPRARLGRRPCDEPVRLRPADRHLQELPARAGASGGRDECRGNDRPARALAARALAPRPLPPPPGPRSRPLSWEARATSLTLASAGVRNPPRPRDGWQRGRGSPAPRFDSRPRRRRDRTWAVCPLHSALDGGPLDRLGNAARELAGTQLAVPFRPCAWLRQPGVRRLVCARRAEPRSLLPL